MPDAVMVDLVRVRCCAFVDGQVWERVDTTTDHGLTARAVLTGPDGSAASHLTALVLQVDGSSRGWTSCCGCSASSAPRRHERNRQAGVMRMMLRAVPVLRLTVRMVFSTTMAMRYWIPYFAAKRCSTRACASGSASTVALPATVGAPALAEPPRLHGCTSTREVCRSRFSLPLPEGVVTSMASPSWTTQTAVPTGAPVLRNVVSRTKLSSPTRRHVSAGSGADDGKAGEVDTSRAYPEALPANP